MADIEQQARELREAARAFYNTVAIKAVVCNLSRSVIGWDAVTAAGARLRLALLDQDRLSIMADGLQPIPMAALRAHEVHSEVVKGGLDLAEASEGLLAANALEHGDDVHPPRDRAVTPVTLANVKPPRNMRVKVRPVAEMPEVL